MLFRSALLIQVGLADYIQHPLSALSGGQKQRVFLARAILNKPKLLILDEPTTSIDTPSEYDFYSLLKTFSAHMAILMISHDLSAVSRTVNKIACLNRKLIFHNSKQLTQSDLEQTYGCAVDMIAHGVPHRVLGCHDH